MSDHQSVQNDPPPSVPIVEGMQAESPTLTRRERVVRPIYLGLGLLCVGLGYVGVIVPGMPSTVFFICAIWAFKRSSPRFENWLLNHRVFGPTLRDWEESRSITKRTKIIAITMIWLCIGLSIALIPRLVGRIILAVTAILLTWFLATRKTKTVPEACQ